MRRLCLVPVALLALGSATVSAQRITAATTFVTANPGANADAVVARLMAFERNHDGVLTRAELPERMQNLVGRLEAGATGEAIDAAAVRRIALTPASPTQIAGFQPGHYGFGDGFNFDTRLHIDGAIDDLRLAADVRDRAKAIARTVQASGADRAKAHLMAAMQEILTPQQMTKFRASLEGQFVTVRAIKQGSVTVFGASPQEVAAGEQVEVLLRTTGVTDLFNAIQPYGLKGDALARATEEIEQFNLHRTGRLSSVDGQAIVEALQGLLDAQQQTDLRAALERRPIVKQGQTVVASGELRFTNVQSAAPLQGGVVTVTGDNIVFQR
jgi:hypothetical protein